MRIQAITDCEASILVPPWVLTRRTGPELAENAGATHKFCPASILATV
jgi:hypothetical protein